jgi:hypothetical protein
MELAINQIEAAVWAFFDAVYLWLSTHENTVRLVVILVASSLFLACCLGGVFIDGKAAE